MEASVVLGGFGDVVDEVGGGGGGEVEVGGVRLGEAVVEEDLGLGRVLFFFFLLVWCVLRATGWLWKLGGME